MNDSLEVQLAAAEAKLALLPADWQEDSSLQTWFPLTAEEFERIKAERDALRVQVQDLLGNEVQNVALQAQNQELREALDKIQESVESYLPIFMLDRIKALAAVTSPPVTKP